MRFFHGKATVRKQSIPDTPRIIFFGSRRSYDSSTLAPWEVHSATDVSGRAFHLLKFSYEKEKIKGIRKYVSRAYCILCPKEEIFFFYE